MKLSKVKEKPGKNRCEAPGIASGYAPGQIKICIFPQATPKAFYCTIFDLRGFLCKFLIALGPRHRLRLCPRANKNLHIPAGYAQSILLHNICLQRDMFSSYAQGISSALGVASGYAPGQIKICIFPQATPKAFYCTIFDLRVFLCKFLIALGPRRRLRLCPRANKNLHIPACYSKTTPRALPLVLSKILKFASSPVLLSA
ncbi:hypothetical protein T06_8082 [Trichinella sp. T6]|nr:hypothetical protein T06_8082 [Trichinella sp. T6]